MIQENFDNDVAAVVSGKRPKPSGERAGRPVRGVDLQALAAAANLAIYVGCRKHKHGRYQGEVGTPGPRPTTVAQAREALPAPPFTMICDLKWNQRDPSKEATELLRSAIRRGQIGHPVGPDGLPQYVWARDPEDPSIVYEARRLTVPPNGYKAYPLIEPQVVAIGLKVL